MLSKQKARTIYGNMLLMSVLGGCLIIVCLLVGAALINIFLVQNQVEKCAEEAALAGAVKLNESNRLGQMNDLIARCRQLIYTSREIFELAPEATPDLQTLAQQLLDEDRENAIELEKERVTLLDVTTSEADYVVKATLERQISIYRNLLPWQKTQIPELVSVQFGSTSGTDSNVAVLTGIEELVEQDKDRKLIDTSAMLYRGNVDAKLPGDDSDLIFKLCSLPAPVNEKVSPARLTLANVFEKQVNKQLPSAIKIVVTGRVATGTKDTHVVTVTSTAATSGAGPTR